MEFETPHEVIEWIKKKVRRYVRGHPDDLDSLAHDIWLEHWEKKTPFTHIAVRHRCYDYLRKLRKREKDMGLTSEVDKVHENKSVHFTDCKQEVEEIILLARLDPESRKLIYFSFYRKLTQKEISEELGIPRSTINDRLAVILRKLRDAWNERKTVATEREEES